MNIFELKDFFENNDFIVHLFEQDNMRCAELESWTKKGVNMIIPLIPFTAESFKDYVENFNEDNEIDAHRMDDSYKKAFSIDVALDDFNAYANDLDRVVELIKVKEEPKHLYIRLKVTDGEREHTHHCVTSTSCNSLDFAVVWYVMHFWGHGDIEKRNYVSSGSKGYLVWFDGEITVELEKWKLLNSDEANFLNELMY